jgi:hypothetical protein
MLRLYLRTWLKSEGSLLTHDDKLLLGSSQLT